MNLFLINLASQTNFEFWRPGQITHFCIPGRKITIFVCNFISDAVACHVTTICLTLDHLITFHKKLISLFRACFIKKVKKMRSQIFE